MRGLFLALEEIKLLQLKKKNKHLFILYWGVAN